MIALKSAIVQDPIALRRFCEGVLPTTLYTLDILDTYCVIHSPHLDGLEEKFTISPTPKRQLNGTILYLNGLYSLAVFIYGQTYVAHGTAPREGSVAVQTESAQNVPEAD